MKLFSKILIILGVIISLVAAKVNIDNLDEVHYYKTNHIEKYVKFTLGSNELDGDSILFYKGQAATITEIYCKTRMRGTAYTAATTDTVKIYGNFNGTGIPVAYLADSMLVTNLPLVSSTGLTTGILTGTEFSIGIPDGKYTDGNNLIDIYVKLNVLK